MKFKLLSAVALAAAMAVAAPMGAAYAQDDQTIIMLGGPSSDPFWGAVQQGFDTAVKDLGVQGQWVAPADFNDIVPIYPKLFEGALAPPPGAIGGGNFFPEPTEPLIKQAAAEGIPVIIINSGGDHYKDLGAIGFIGEDSYQMG